MLRLVHPKNILTAGLLLVFTLTAALAQTRVSGQITDPAGVPLPGVSLTVKGKVSGTITDSKGNFSLTTNTAPPFTLLVSSVGYKGQEVAVTSNNATFTLKMEDQPLIGQEIVVSASRVEETVLKSPVAVEKMDIRAIQSTPAANFYDGLANFKGVDMATQGLLFKSINMRGFGATGNPRTVQMIDGMDNSAPGLNFPVDNIVGMPEIDVESVEILPGAASALYGPNAINGLILMTSKSPFLYQGLSANVRTGVMSASNRTTQSTGFYDASIRYAKAINNRLAFKVNLAYITADDWQANDFTNLNVNQRGIDNPARGAGVSPGYDGVNVYGDETNRTIAGRVVSRTGFLERDLVDYNTKSFKFNGALHYRVTEKAELIGQFNYGYGTTVYTGNGRYSLRGFSLAQAKVELRGSNYTLRAYTTQERSGDSYTAGLAALGMDRAFKTDDVWYTQYQTAYNAAIAANQNADAAHLAARGAADQGRPQPGTPAFQTLLDTWRDRPITQGGGAFLDKSAMYHAEGVYNLKDQIKFVDVLVGANFRNYQLISEGTLFADQVEGRNGSIGINEWGGFVQASKSLFGDHLKLSGSIRYDKNQNFDGQFTPRVSAVGTFGDHTVRLSYQTGFRIPTTQNQYIDLATPNARLIGGLPEFFTRYDLANSYPLSNVQAVGTQVQATGANPAFQQQQVGILTGVVTSQVTAAVLSDVTARVTQQVQAGVAAGQIPAAQAAAVIQAQVTAQMSSSAVQGIIRQNVTAGVAANAPNFIQAQAIAANLSGLRTYQQQEFKPERVANYEIGYRGIWGKKLFVDGYYYHSVYTNFIGGVVLLQPTASVAPQLGLPLASGVFTGGTRRGFSMAANSSERITASGWALGLNYSIGNGYAANFNISQNQLDNFKSTDEVQYAAFNTPEYRWNVGFTKRPTNTSKIGFGVTFRHQAAFTWESGFVQPSETGTPFFTNTQVPAINNLDAQVSYKLTGMKSVVKVGATNLGGTPYIQAFGNPAVGSMYYVGITFDQLSQ
jgi:iron complex outermembrane recepter protein